MARARSSSSPVLPIALAGLGVYGVSRLLAEPATSNGPRLLGGTVPADRPYVQLVFRADSNPTTSLAGAARFARDRVLEQLEGESPLFVVTASSERATDSPAKSPLGAGYAFTTVVARTAGFLAGRTWSSVLAPLVNPDSSTWDLAPNVQLVDARIVDGSQVNPSRESELANQAKAYGGETVGQIERILKTAVVLGGGLLLLNLVRDLRD